MSTVRLSDPFLLSALTDSGYCLYQRAIVYDSFFNQGFWAIAGPSAQIETSSAVSGIVGSAPGTVGNVVMLGAPYIVSDNQLLDYDTATQNVSNLFNGQEYFLSFYVHNVQTQNAFFAVDLGPENIFNSQEHASQYWPGWTSINISFIMENTTESTQRLVFYGENRYTLCLSKNVNNAAASNVTNHLFNLFPVLHMCGKSCPNFHLISNLRDELLGLFLHL